MIFFVSFLKNNELLVALITSYPEKIFWIPDNDDDLHFLVWIIVNFELNAANMYSFKVNNKNTRKKGKICRRSGVFIVNFEHVLHLFLVFLLLTLNK